MLLRAALHPSGDKVCSRPLKRFFSIIQATPA
jgi:hypothetical protein